MFLFWQKGYAETSIGDLVEVTGVQRYGLYSTFGEKHAFFLKCLDYYLDVMVSQMVQGMEAEGAGWEAIESFFDTLLYIAGEPTNEYGCLMCRSASEMGRSDEDVAQKMAAYTKRLGSCFEKSLVQSQIDGVLGNQLDIKKAAHYLLYTTVSFFNLSKSGVSNDHLTEFMNVSLQGVKALSKE
ncbi:MAG: TetR family transcriptional regulator [Chloroflexota bacterium]